MSNVYNTADLIKILAEERQACLQGRRYNLAANPYTGNPVVDCFLKPDAVQKFTAYQDFKKAVHCYQQEQQVSGIIWRQITLGGKMLNYPMVDDQLMALPSDLEILKGMKTAVVAFWQQGTRGMDLFLSIQNSKEFRLILPKDVDGIVARTEWATLAKWEKSDFLEIVLQLGWGQPEEAAYRRGWPRAGSEYIHAVKPGKQPIC